MFIFHSSSEVFFRFREKKKEKKKKSNFDCQRLSPGGMVAIMNAENCNNPGGKSHVPPFKSQRVRQHYIGIENVNWDYGPTGQNLFDGGNLVEPNRYQALSLTHTRTRTHTASSVRMQMFVFVLFINFFLSIITASSVKMQAFIFVLFLKCS